MAKITLYLDEYNFNYLMSNKSFQGWSDESTVENIQISLPLSAIGTYDHHGNGSILFKCHPKENW